MKTLFILTCLAFQCAHATMPMNVSTEVICKVASTTKMRMFTEVIEAGSIAVLDSNEAAQVKDLLADQAIYFRDSAGKISTSYQWMYSAINRVEGRTDKYLSSSYHEDVVLTIAEQANGVTLITYVGTHSGNYLTLICKTQSPSNEELL